MSFIKNSIFGTFRDPWSIVTIAHEMYRIFVNFRCISLILVMNYLEKKNLFVSAKDEIEAPFS